MMMQKRRAGRKKFQETRHPIYKGVRQRNGKWVCELREPKNNKTRVWLGTFSNPHMAAIAYDVAVLAFRGENASLNFPHSATSLPRLSRETNSIKTIQMAAMRAAEEKHFSVKEKHFSVKEKVNNDNNNNISTFGSHDEFPWFGSCILDDEEENNVKAKDIINIISNNSDDNNFGSQHDDEFSLDCNFGDCCSSIEREEEDCRRLYWDEEEVFDMPGLMNSMAEGLIITPPALQSGFSWVGEETTVDLTLWRD